MKLKKRIVGFLLLLGIVLVIIPVFFGHAIPVDELKLSGRVPAAPAKPKDIEMPIPLEAATLPEKIPALQTAPVLPTPSPITAPASETAKQTVAPSALATPLAAQPVASVQPPVQQNAASAEGMAAKEISIPPAISAPVVTEAASPDAIAPLVATAPRTSALKKQGAQTATPKSSPAHAKNASMASAVLSTGAGGVEKKPKPAVKNTAKNTPPPIGALVKEGWVVQLGTFAQKPNAENLTKKLKSQSLVAYMQPIKTKSGGYITKVFVGPYSDRKDAAQLRTRIQQEWNMEGILVKTSGHS